MCLYFCSICLLLKRPLAGRAPSLLIEDLNDITVSMFTSSRLFSLELGYCVKEMFVLQYPIGLRSLTSSNLPGVCKS
ncbi:hypothetical protein KC19_11G113200 [Ceratodon purpureus]|uniref:Uncharacterized protein n=1 Tax=Ceratodon purpureus TaxID=3225 RepID=A0A8T0GEY9_CERPU|nr:hypothetical protein KC19_11G113200 [Ceratodon purpureus]